MREPKARCYTHPTDPAIPLDESLFDFPGVEIHLHAIREALAAAVTFARGVRLEASDCDGENRDPTADASRACEETCERAWKMAVELTAALPSPVQCWHVVPSDAEHKPPVSHLVPIHADAAEVQ